MHAVFRVCWGSLSLGLQGPIALLRSKLLMEPQPSRYPERLPCLCQHVPGHRDYHSSLLHWNHLEWLQLLLREEEYGNTEMEPREATSGLGTQSCHRLNSQTLNEKVNSYICQIVKFIKPFLQNALLGPAENPKCHDDCNYFHFTQKKLNLSEVLQLSHSKKRAEPRPHTLPLPTNLEFFLVSPSWKQISFGMLKLTVTDQKVRESQFCSRNTAH